MRREIPELALLGHSEDPAHDECEDAFGREVEDGFTLVVDRRMEASTVLGIEQVDHGSTLEALPDESGRVEVEIHD
jgi:hypothetical protein